MAGSRVHVHPDPLAFGVQCVGSFEASHSSTPPSVSLSGPSRGCTTPRVEKQKRSMATTTAPEGFDESGRRRYSSGLAALSSQYQQPAATSSIASTRVRTYGAI